MKELLEVLVKCREAGISIMLDDAGTTLKVKGNIKNLRSSDKEMLTRHKEDIIALLNKARETSYGNILQAGPQVSYPLSSAQKRLWVLSQLPAANVAYNIPSVYVLEGSLKRENLATAFHHLIARHEILRTLFREDETGAIRQFILTPEDTGFSIGYKDLRHVEEQETAVREAVRDESLYPFDLSGGLLLRAVLYQLTDTKWIFLYTLHHIIGDAWSMNILIRELLWFYDVADSRVGHDLKPLRLQYKDYAVWELVQSAGKAMDVHKSWWLGQLEGVLPVLEFPGDRMRPAVKTYRGGVVYRTMNAALTDGVKQLAAAQGATLFMGLLAAITALLNRYTNQEDIIIGTAVAGREQSGLEDQVGCYTNTLALRIPFRGDDSYRELLTNTKRVTIDAFEHQVYPFDKLIEELSLRHDMSRNPLFEISVVLQNTDINKRQQPENTDGLHITGYEDGKSPVSKFDLSFDFMETWDEIQTSILYNKDIYDSSTVERLGDHLIQLLHAVISTPDVAINRTEYLSPAEKYMLSIGLNNTSVDFPENKTIAELFEEQAAKTPEGIALVFDNTRLTYRALNEKSNQLANYLHEHYNIQADDLVGIMMDPSDMMIIAILGVLKSGGGYVPVDPKDPAERKAFIIKDTGIKVFITQFDHITDLESPGVAFFAIDVQFDLLPACDGPCGAVCHGGNVAYVMYTSGTTGAPKG